MTVKTIAIKVLFIPLYIALQIFIRKLVTEQRKIFLRYLGLETF